MLLPRPAYPSPAPHLSTFSAPPEALDSPPLAPVRPCARPWSPNTAPHWLCGPPLSLMCQFEGLRRRVAAERRSPRSLEVRRPGARGGRRAEPAGAGRAAAAAVPGGTGAGGRMELNSLLILLEAAEYLERRDRGSARAPLCARSGGRAAGPGRAGAADRAVCPQRPSTATPRCCPSTATSPGRKQRRPAWCARPRTTGTAPHARPRPARTPAPARSVVPGPGFPARCPQRRRRAPRRPAWRRRRAGRGRSPARPAPPSPSPSSCGRASWAARVNSATRTAPAVGVRSRARSPPPSCSGLFQAVEKLSAGAGRCPVGLGKQPQPGSPGSAGPNPFFPRVGGRPPFD